VGYRQVMSTEGIIFLNPENDVGV